VWVYLYENHNENIDQKNQTFDLPKPIRMKKVLITTVLFSLLGILLICSKQEEDVLDVLIPPQEDTRTQGHVQMDTSAYTQPMYPSVIQ